MMIKKKTAVFLLAAMTMGVSGTGAFAEETTEAIGETDAGDASGSSAEETAGEVPAVLSDDIYSFQIKLDGEVYSFPMSYDDFAAHGWEYDGDEELELTPNSYTGETFYKGDLGAYVQLLNVGLNTAGYDGCSIGGMSIDSSDAEDAPDTVIEFPKGITFGTSTLEDVKAAYGEASSVYEGESYTSLTYEYGSYQEWEFYIDAETGVLNEFDVRNFVYDEEANAAAAAEVSGEPTELVLAYEEPSELGDDVQAGIVEFAGDLYRLPAPVSVFLENGFTLKPEDSDSVVAGQDFGWFSMLRDGQEFRGNARNYDPNATTIENCFVVSVSSEKYDTDLPLLIPGGLTRGLTSAELTPLLEGLPYEISSDTDDYTYYTVQEKSDNSWSIQITYSKEEDAVISLEYEKRMAS